MAQDSDKITFSNLKIDMVDCLDGSAISHIVFYKILTFDYQGNF